ncbi:hypothetical protein WIA93_08290 [Citrobacter amalonaticus]|uniref:hypothetical protein n=1 Tax=Citrobacter amalonaticus TaxID=35703 RepID=UPI00339C7D6D
MDSNISELVKLGHERADELKAACGAVDVRSVAQLISDLASQLEVQYVRSNALAAENAHMQQVIGDVQTLYYESDGIVGYHLNGDIAKWDDVMPDLWAETPATDAYLAEVRTQGVTEYASKRGFSFQHGSIHAHFGNGDVMVGSVTFENGDAGINFAPVREKTGGVGTHYEWTKGKTAEQVDSVFVIASSNAEGLEVIRDKLSEAIAQLRKGDAQ